MFLAWISFVYHELPFLYVPGIREQNIIISCHYHPSDGLQVFTHFHNLWSQLTISYFHNPGKSKWFIQLLQNISRGWRINNYVVAGGAAEICCAAFLANNHWYYVYFLSVLHWIRLF